MGLINRGGAASLSQVPVGPGRGLRGWSIVVICRWTELFPAFSWKATCGPSETRLPSSSRGGRRRPRGSTTRHRIVCSPTIRTRTRASSMRQVGIYATGRRNAVLSIAGMSSSDCRPDCPPRPPIETSGSVYWIPSAVMALPPVTPAFRLESREDASGSRAGLSGSSSTALVSSEDKPRRSTAGVMCDRTRRSMKSSRMRGATKPACTPVSPAHAGAPCRGRGRARGSGRRCGAAACPHGDPARRPHRRPSTASR